METSFQVDLRTKPSHVFHARKRHNKSREGCLTCKRRRVKCDETKPQCRVCERRGLDCFYATCRSADEGAQSSEGSPLESEQQSISQSPQSLVVPAPDARAYNLSVQAMQDRLGEAVRATRHRVSLPSEIKSLRDLQHFQSITAQTLGFSVSMKVLSTFVSQAIWQHTHLMHMVLAVANAHQKRLYSADKHEAIGTSISLAEASHWQVALELYQSELESVKNGKVPSQDDADALLGTNLLSTVFTSTVDDDIPSEAFINASESEVLEVLSPMISAGGFRALMSLLPSVDSVSAWSAVFNTADDEQRSFTDDTPGIEGLPPAWVELCSLTSASTHENHPYHRMLRTLSPLLKLRLGRADLPKMFAYVGRNWAYSRHLFISKDPIALLFFAWWLALLRQLDLWWIMTRASTKCAAIVRYLRSINDPRLEPFLSFPASFGLADYSWIWSADWQLVLQEFEQDNVSDPQHLCLPS